MKHTSTVETVAPDPLLHNVSLPLQATFYPIGFTARISTNDPNLIAAAEESWGAFEQRFSAPAIEIRIAVSPDDNAIIPASPRFRAQGHLLAIVSDSVNFAMCDLAAGFAFCWLGKGAAASRAWTRHFFLDAIAYATLVHLHVTGVHAACVARNSRGVLLCGPSGMGKSVLALECARRGWTFVTDDVAYLLRESDGRTVLGKPARMKFLPSASGLFPDIAWKIPGSDPTGEPFVELPTADINIAIAELCEADYLVFLQRKPTAARDLLPIGSDETLARLAAELPAFEHSVHQAHLKSLEILSHLPAFELHYDHVEGAVPLLDDLIGGSA